MPVGVEQGNGVSIKWQDGNFFNTIWIWLRISKWGIESRMRKQLMRGMLARHAKFPKNWFSYANFGNFCFCGDFFAKKM
ncbi:MAG: hypothetical protein HC806_05045 [Anaerolineae bacterium]|nr:hypothetical protein [Anaerolineae bacterium]